MRRCCCRSSDFVSADAGNALELGSDNKLFVAEGGGAGLPYAVYTATLVQVGEGAPTPTIFYNSLGFEPQWTYQEPGLYPLLSDGNFTVGKTQVLFTNMYQNVVPLHLWALLYDAGYIEVRSHLSNNSPSNDWNAQVEIRIYP